MRRRRFCFLGLVTPPGVRGRRAPRSKCLTSLDLNDGPSKLTCYPCAEAIRHKLLNAKRSEQKRDGVKWRHLQSGFARPRLHNARSNTPKRFSRRVAVGTGSADHTSGDDQMEFFRGGLARGQPPQIDGEAARGGHRFGARRGTSRCSWRPGDGF